MSAMTDERMDDLRRTPRQADVTDVEDLVSEVDRLRSLVAQEPDAYLYTCWKSGACTIYASVDPGDTEWVGANWRGVTRTPLVALEAEEQLYGEPRPESMVGNVAT